MVKAHEEILPQLLFLYLTHSCHVSPVLTSPRGQFVVLHFVAVVVTVHKYC